RAVLVRSASHVHQAMNEYMTTHHKPASASYPSSPAVVLPPTPQQVVSSPPPQYSADSPPAGARASSKAGRKPARKVRGASSTRRTALATPKESVPSAPLSRTHPDLDPHSRCVYLLKTRLPARVSLIRSAFLCNAGRIDVAPT